MCNYPQKQRICRENSKYAPYKNFHGLFGFDERLSTSATLFVFCFAQVDESHRRDVPSPAESGAKADNSDQLPPSLRT